MEKGIISHFISGLDYESERYRIKDGVLFYHKYCWRELAYKDGNNILVEFSLPNHNETIKLLKLFKSKEQYTICFVDSLFYDYGTRSYNIFLNFFKNCNSICIHKYQEAGFDMFQYIYNYTIYSKSHEIFLEAYDEYSTKQTNSKYRYDLNNFKFIEPYLLAVERKIKINSLSI